MIHAYATTYCGVHRVELQLLYEGIDEGIAIHFQVDSSSMYNERQAIEDVADLVQKSQVDWLVPETGRWTVHLDKLRELGPDLRTIAWLSGSVRVRPEFKIERASHSLHSNLRGRVSIIVRPEDIMTDPTKCTLFYSYTHKDEKYRAKLDVHLGNMKRQGLISGWYDGKITGGKEWDAEIKKRLEEAQIILLLVSAEFLDSDYCHGVEVKRALERHGEGTARVVPIIVRPCDWRSTLFGKLLALPKDAKAITNWKRQDDAYLDIALGIRKVIEELKGHPSSPHRTA
jgi:hypothetical protein